jgi:hypothetical protein
MLFFILFSSGGTFYFQHLPIRGILAGTLLAALQFEMSMWTALTHFAHLKPNEKVFWFMMQGGHDSGILHAIDRRSCQEELLPVISPEQIRQTRAEHRSPHRITDAKETFVLNFRLTPLLGRH